MSIFKCFVTGVGLLVILPLPAMGDFINDFDSGDEGWIAYTVNNGGKVKSFSPDYHATGGVSDGYITGDIVKNKGNKLYCLEAGDPSAFADLTTQESLSVYTRLAGNIDLVDNPTARIYVGSYTGGNNYYVSNNEVSWNPNFDTDWTLHQIALDPENFIEWPNQAAHSKSFEEVIAGPEDIGLVFTTGREKFNRNSLLGFRSSKGAALGVDNFSAGTGPVPEPATLMLLVSGVLFLGNRRLRAV